MKWTLLRKIAIIAAPGLSVSLAPEVAYETRSAIDDHGV